MNLEGGIWHFVWLQFLACFFYFPMPVPIAGWRKLAVCCNSVITFKIKIYKSYAFPSSSREEVTELCHPIFVLSRETSPFAFLLILPELICFAGKEYVCVPDPMPECIPSATKRKKK